MSSIIDTISSLATGGGSSGSKTSSERLFLARARYADTLHQGNDGRGQFAYIKLLSNATLKPAYSSGDTSKREMTDSKASELFKWANKMVGSGGGYDKFLMTGITGSITEKVQVNEVFGDGEIVYYFGRQPMYLTISGILIDSPDNQWFTDWLRMYSEFFRGTQLAKNYELLKLVLPNMTAVGSITGFNWSQDSTNDVNVSFSFQFLVKSLAPNPVTNSKMVSSNGVQEISFSKANNFLSKSGINALKLTSAASIIQNPLSSLLSKSSALSSIGSTLQSFQSSINGLTSSLTSGVSSFLSSSLMTGINSALMGIRSSLFSPVYGILSSLTKFISTVYSSGVAIFNAFTMPFQNLLRDIISIGNKATALVNLIKGLPSALGRYANSRLSSLDKDYKTALSSVGRAVGSLTSGPTTSLHTLASLHASSHGPATTRAFLKATNRSSFSRAVLPSGVKQKDKTALLTYTLNSTTANNKV